MTRKKDNLKWRVGCVWDLIRGDKQRYIFTPNEEEEEIESYLKNGWQIHNSETDRVAFAAYYQWSHHDFPEPGPEEIADALNKRSNDKRIEELIETLSTHATERKQHDDKDYALGVKFAAIALKKITAC